MFLNKFKRNSIISSSIKNSLKFTNLLYTKSLQVRYFSVIGMEMGGTNTCIAIVEGSGPRVIENAEGLRTTPSCISIDEEGTEFVATAAKRMYIQNMNNSFYGTKFFFGRKFSEPFVQQLLKRFPFKIEKGPEDEIYFLTEKNKNYTPRSVSSLYLKYVREQAEALTGKPVKKVVMSVPSFIEEKGLKELKDTLKDVGMDIVKFVNESKSAALAYNLHENEKVKKFVVFNFGGMNSSLAYLERNQDVNSESLTKMKSQENSEQSNVQINEDIFSLKSEFFDYFLGGEDIDSIIINFLLKEFERINKMDISKDLFALQRIRDAAEQAKIELTNSQQAEISLPFLAANESGPKHLNMRLSRSKFETLIDPITTKLKKNCEEFIKNNNINIKEIDDILLVGGISRINRIQEIIKQVFGRDPNTSLNPEEAPAVGASLLASQVKLKIEEIQNMDKLPLSLGIETLAGEFTRIINKDTLLPIKITKIFTTVIDKQPKLDLKIYFGEREIASENRLIGTFSVVIPLLKRGEPRIHITFSINNKGELFISAQEELTKKTTSYSAKINSGLTQEIVEEILEMKDKQDKSDDKKIKMMKFKIEIDDYIYYLENCFSKYKEKIESEMNDEELEKIHEGIKNLNEQLNTDKYDEIMDLLLNLQKDSIKIQGYDKN